MESSGRWEWEGLVGGVGTVTSCDISSAHWSEQHDDQSGGEIEKRVTSVLSAAP